MQYMIICGNPCDGFHYIGPFADHDSAIAYMETSYELSQCDAWVTELDAPAEGEATKADDVTFEEFMTEITAIMDDVAKPIDINVARLNREAQIKHDVQKWVDWAKKVEKE